MSDPKSITQEASEQFIAKQLAEAQRDENQRWHGKVYAVGKEYCIQDGNGGSTTVPEHLARKELVELGVRAYKEKAEELSPLDRALLVIQKRYKVDFASPMAGYKAGILYQNGFKILVTSTTKLIEPVEGEFPTIGAILRAAAE